VRRSATGTQVTFASGHTIELDAAAEWQEVADEPQR
jgi:hypothetical protein